MLTNIHTHTTFCDGKNTPEEIVLRAIDKGFDSVGFSGHGNTPFDLLYCMKDTQGYISTVRQLKEKYKNRIQIYLGVEEDAFAPTDRSCFDYIIGSSHYLLIDGKYYPVDSGVGGMKKCIELFDGDVVKLSESYYSAFCDYISRRKPDVVGHFDLITKYDEIDTQMFLCNEGYLKLADKYMLEAIKSECIFEVNTGAISRGVRSTPYPHERLLYILKKHDAKIMLSADSHSADTLDFHFNETRKLLCEIGFTYVYVLYDNEFKKDYL